jgi:hypothetical protein
MKNCSYCTDPFSDLLTVCNLFDLGCFVQDQCNVIEIWRRLGCGGEGGIQDIWSLRRVAIIIATNQEESSMNTW